MTATPVGMRCPECSKQRQKVHTMRSMAVEPRVTYVLIALCVIAFVLERPFTSGGTSTFELDFATIGVGLTNDGPIGVSQGEWWRLITGGFLHDPGNPLHILFNMYILFWLGRMIEPALGHARYVGIYLASLFAGSLGVMILSPNDATLGASGAIYGLLGAAIVMARNRNISLIQSGLLPILAINFALTVTLPGISLGGHLGGLIGGLIATFVVEQLAMRRRGDTTIPAVIACAVLAVIAAVASVSIA